MTHCHQRPSLLGCYWEWVSGVVGTAVPGVGYMHRPATWPILEFTPPPPKLPGGGSSSGSAPIAPEPCRNIEYPGRHVALSVHIAQMVHAKLHNGSFATEVETLMNPIYCNLQLHTSDTCDLRGQFRLPPSPPPPPSPRSSVRPVACLGLSQSLFAIILDLSLFYVFFYSSYSTHSLGAPSSLSGMLPDSPERVFLKVYTDALKSSDCG